MLLHPVRGDTLPGASLMDMSLPAVFYRTCGRCAEAAAVPAGSGLGLRGHLRPEPAGAARQRRSSLTEQERAPERTDGAGAAHTRHACLFASSLSFPFVLPGAHVKALWVKFHQRAATISGPTALGVNTWTNIAQSSGSGARESPQGGPVSPRALPAPSRG